MLLKINSIEDSLWMTVKIDSDTAAVLRIDSYWHSGYVPFGEILPEPKPETEPVWNEDLYFPQFPETDRIYAFQVNTDLDDHKVSWVSGWRINSSYETMMALTLVGMQGIINRNKPRVYLDCNKYSDVSSYWIPYIKEEVDVIEIDLDHLSIFNFLYERYGSRFSGAVIYDPEVPETINIATMKAGLENLIILAPEQIGLPGIPEFDYVYDLRDLVQQNNWDTSDGSKLSIYQWVYDNLWQNLEKRILGTISPGPPTSQSIESGFFPLGLVQREYIVSLKLSALWLDPRNSQEAELYSRFFDDAPSPIPVLGVTPDEYSSVDFISNHGNWNTCMAYPNGPLSPGNLSVFSAINPSIKKQPTAINSSNILNTLGEKPVATIFCSDGDNLQFQVDRGFHGAVDWIWDNVQGNKFGWTTNPTLSNIAPLIWNYYIDSQDEVELICGYSGAGFSRPYAMNETQLQEYIAKTAIYLNQTGLRTVRVWKDNNWNEDIVRFYYDGLKNTDFLGIIHGAVAPPYGTLLSFHGFPSPSILTGYVLEPSTLDQVIDDIFARQTDSIFIDLCSYNRHNGTVVVDNEAINGQSVLFSNSSYDFTEILNGPFLILPPGDYSVTLNLKVSDNQITEDFMDIFIGYPIYESYGAAISGWKEFVRQRISPDEFDEPSIYKKINFSFTLEKFYSEIEIVIGFKGAYSDINMDYILIKKDDPDNFPLFVPLIMVLTTGERQADTPYLFNEKFENTGGLVLTPNEFLAALNPEYMIELAEPILGSGNAGLVEAKNEYASGNYYKSLIAVRNALKPQVVSEIVLTPPSTTVEINNTCSLNVYIGDITDLGAFQFDMIYDSDIVKADTVLMGTLPGSTGRTVTQTVHNIDNSNGKITFGGSTSGAESGAGSSGILATAIFTIIGTDTAFIELDNVQVSNTGGQSLTLGTVGSAKIIAYSSWDSWILQEPGRDNRLFNVLSVSDNKVWASGENGTVLKSIDGGESWENIWTGADTLCVYNVAEVDENSVLISTSIDEQGTYAAHIFRTSDGGNTWVDVYSQTGGFINSIKMFDQLNGIATGDPVDGVWTVIKTTDGGNTWFSISDPPAAIDNEQSYLNSTTWVDNSTGWFGTNKPRAYRTSDGGNTWTAVDIPDLSRVYSIAFNMSGMGIAVNYNGQMARTIDNGANWEVISAPASGTIYYIAACYDYFWMIVGSSIYKSTDNGTTWILDGTSPEPIRRLSFYTDQNGIFGWAVGNEGTVLRYKSRITNINTENDEAIPEHYSLFQNYPNPFNPETTIKYEIPNKSDITLKIYNLLGQEVKTLINESKKAGYHQIIWDGRNNNGVKVGSGIYIYRIQAGDFVKTKKMVLIK